MDEKTLERSSTKKEKRAVTKAELQGLMNQLKPQIISIKLFLQNNPALPYLQFMQKSTECNVLEYRLREAKLKLKNLVNNKPALGFPDGNEQYNTKLPNEPSINT